MADEITQFPLSDSLHVARQRLADRLKKPRDKLEALSGKLDHTPAIRKNLAEDAVKAKALTAALAQIDRAFGKDSPPYVPQRPESMTEAVARELCRQRLLIDEREIPPDRLRALVDQHWETFVERARDLFGVMTTATEEMLNDVEGWQDKDEYQELETAREQIEFIWQALLDSAESEYSAETLARRASQAEWDAMTPEQQRAHWDDWGSAKRPNGSPF